MITEHDKKTVDTIKKYINRQAMVREAEVDWEKIHWIETLDKLVNNLCIAPLSFRFCSPEDIANRFYTAECSVCGWWGSSKLLAGGGPIADTGDYFDCSCPVCGNDVIDEKDDGTMKTMNIFAEKGTKVKVTEKTKCNGYNIDKDNIKDYLTIEKEYTVEKTIVDDFSSEVLLEEVPNVYFNTVNFVEV